MRGCAPTLMLILLCRSAFAGEASPAEPPIEAPAPSPHEVARQLFSSAVALARAGEHAKAKAAFLDAYAAEPHYLVLYNVAQVDLEMGDLASAVSYLRRFLAEGGSAIAVEQRQAVERELERVEARRAQLAASSPPEPSGSMVRDAIVANPDTREAVAASSALEAAPPPTATQLATAAVPAASTEPTVGGDGPRRIWGYVLTSSGFAVLGGALGLYAWNHERYGEWRDENDALIAYRGDILTRGLEPAADASLKARAEANNARLESVQRFDAVPILTAGIGIVALATGLWVLLDARESAPIQVSSSPSDLGLQARWAW